MKPFLLVAPLAALYGTAVAAPSVSNDADLAAQTKSEANVPTQSRFASFSNFYQQFEDAPVQDVVNLWNSGATEDDIRSMRAASSPFAVNIQNLDDVSKIFSRVGLGKFVNKRSEEAGNPLMNLFMKNGSDMGGGGKGGLKLPDFGKLLMGGGGGGGGGKGPDIGNLFMRIKDVIQAGKPLQDIQKGLKTGGRSRKLGNFLAVLFPVTGLVSKLGLNSLLPLTLIVDDLLLIVLGLSPIVGKLLLNIGLIGMKEEMG